MELQLLTTVPADNKISVAPMSLKPSFRTACGRVRFSVVTARTRELLGVLHAFADDRVLVVGRGHDAGDLQVLEDRGILDRKQALLQRFEDRALDSGARDPRLSDVVESRENAQRALLVEIHERAQAQRSRVEVAQ